MLPTATPDWTRLGSIVTLPTGVERLVFLLLTKNQAPGEKTWFDDLCTEKLCNAPAPK